VIGFTRVFTAAFPCAMTVGRSMFVRVRQLREHKDIRGTIPRVIIVETSLIMLNSVVSNVTISSALVADIKLWSIVLQVVGVLKLQTAVAEIVAPIALLSCPVKCLMSIGRGFDHIFVSHLRDVHWLHAFLLAGFASMVRCHF
jgi:hypothetical protein